MDTITITTDDLVKGKYVFGKDVLRGKQEGVSPTGTQTKSPDSIFDVTYNFAGLTVGDVLENSIYKLGVNFRSSVRKLNYFPDDTVKVAVPATNGRMQMSDLPAAQQAIAIFASLPEPQRSRAIEAFLSTQD